MKLDLLERKLQEMETDSPSPSALSPGRSKPNRYSTQKGNTSFLQQLLGKQLVTQIPQKSIVENPIKLPQSRASTPVRLSKDKYAPIPQDTYRTLTDARRQLVQSVQSFRNISEEQIGEMSFEAIVHNPEFKKSLKAYVLAKDAAKIHGKSFANAAQEMRHLDFRRNMSREDIFDDPVGESLNIKFRQEQLERIAPAFLKSDLQRLLENTRSPSRGVDLTAKFEVYRDFVSPDTYAAIPDNKTLIKTIIDKGKAVSITNIKSQVVSALPVNGNSWLRNRKDGTQASALTTYSMLQYIHEQKPYLSCSSTKETEGFSHTAASDLIVVLKEGEIYDACSIDGSSVVDSDGYKQLESNRSSNLSIEKRVFGALVSRGGNGWSYNELLVRNPTIDYVAINPEHSHVSGYQQMWQDVCTFCEENNVGIALRYNDREERISLEKAKEYAGILPVKTKAA